MIIFYRASIQKSDTGIENIVEPVGESSKELIVPEIQNRESVCGISRKKVSESGIYNLKEIKKGLQYFPKQEREEIQRRLKKISKDYTVIKDYSQGCKKRTCFFDLDKNPIGSVDILNPASEFHASFPRFDVSFVRNLGLTFELSKSYEELIRATVFLTDAGKKSLECYLDRKFLKRAIEKREGFNRQTYDLDFDGILVHLNLRGKVEIYAKSDSLNGRLVGSGDLKDDEWRALKNYTQFSKYKKWPRQTTPQLNLAIGEVFEQLSIAVGEMIV